MKDINPSRLPDYSEKQRLFYGEKAAEGEIRNAANQAQECGVMSDAIDLLARLKDNEGLEKLRNLAFDEGDFFIFNKATKAMGDEPTPDVWSKLAARAHELGKLQYALSAYQQCGNNEKEEELKKQIDESLGSHEQQEEEQQP